MLASSQEWAASGLQMAGISLCSDGEGIAGADKGTDQILQLQ